MPDFPLPAFAGWDTPHYTAVPDELFDWWLPHLSEAELKVLLYIMRRTFGFKKDADAISLSQMRDGIVRRDGTRLDCGAGCSESSIIRGLRKLQEKGLVDAHKQRTAEGDADTTVYRLRLRGPVTMTGPSSQIDRAPPPRVTGPVLSNSGAQETAGQETEHKRDGEGAGSLPENAAGPSLAAVLAPYGGAWAKEQERAAQLARARGWSPAQLAEQLAARREPGLRAKLVALADG